MPTNILLGTPNTLNWHNNPFIQKTINGSETVNNFTISFLNHQNHESAGCQNYFEANSSFYYKYFFIVCCKYTKSIKIIKPWFNSSGSSFFSLNWIKLIKNSFWQTWNFFNSSWNYLYNFLNFRDIINVCKLLLSKWLEKEILKNVANSSFEIILISLIFVK